MRDTPNSGRRGAGRCRDSTAQDREEATGPDGTGVIQEEDPEDPVPGVQAVSGGAADSEAADAEDKGFQT